MEPYTGRYQFINNVVITISKEKDRLFAQPTGQSKLELFPVSATEFVLKEINARITFVKDENSFLFSRVSKNFK